MSLKQRLLPGARVISGLCSFLCSGGPVEERAMGSDGRAGSRSSLALWGISEKAR